MRARFTCDILRIFLSVSVATGGLPAFAAKPGEGFEPQLATGGGGSIPPIDRPVKYFGEGDGDEEAARDENKGPRKPSQGKFGQLFREGIGRQPNIYYLGYVNQNGVYVYQVIPSHGMQSRARRGVYREGKGISWERDMVWISQVRKGIEPEDLPTATGGKGGDSKPPEPPRNGSGKASSEAGRNNSHRFGEYFGEYQKNGRSLSIYHEGWTDNLGRVRVFAKKSLQNDYFIVRRGSVSADGQSVEWLGGRSNSDPRSFRAELGARNIQTDLFDKLPEFNYHSTEHNRVRTEQPAVKQTKVQDAAPNTSGYIPNTMSATGDLLQPIQIERGQDTDGRKSFETIYRKGIVDSQGRELVFKPEAVNGQSTFKVVREGRLSSDGILIWKGESRPIEDLLTELRSIDVSRLPLAKRAAFQRQLGQLANYGRESFRPALKYSTSPTPASSGILTGGLLEARTVGSSQQTVYLQGQRDAQGRDLIFRPDTSGGKVNPNVIRTGVLAPDGTTVQWNDGAISRAELVRRLKAADTKSLPEPQRAQYLDSVAKLESADIAGQQKLYPDYRESPQDKAPLAREKSLTVIPGQTTQTQSPGTSRYTGVLPVGQGYRDVYQDNARPSKLAQSLEWSSQKAAQVRDILNGVKTGTLDRYHKTMENSPKTGQQAIDHLKNSPKTLQIGGISFAFYSALGIAAAYNLMLDYPNNPNAFDNYLETLTNPAGYAALATFILVAAPFFRYVQRAEKAGHYYRQIPIYVSGLMIATWASTAAAKFAQDPTVRSCLGFVGQAVHARFTWNMDACDKAYARWVTDERLQERLLEITNEFLPAATSMLAAMAVYKGLLKTGEKVGKWAGEKTTILDKFQKISLFKNPSSMWGRGVLNLGSYGMYLGLFMGAYYLVSSKVGLNLEARTSNWLLADYGLTLNHVLPLMGLIPGSQRYAYEGFQNWLENKGSTAPSSVTEAEDQLLSGWSSVKAKQWQDPSTWPGACRQGKPWHQFNNCEQPMSFAKLLDNYHLYQTSWRKLQMKPVFDLFDEWKKKTSDHNGQIAAAYTFYKNAVDRILYSKKHEPAYPPIPEDRLLFFSGNALNITKEASPIDRDERFGGIWRYIDTPTQRDFLFTSLACGPEVEGQSAESLIDKLTSFLSPITGSLGPKNVLDYSHTSNIRFYPPRIVAPLANDPMASICERGSGLFNVYKPAILGGSTRFAPLQVPVNVGEKTYADMGEYILNNVRSTVLNGDENRFDEWWTKHTLKEVVRIQQIIRQDYEKMLQYNYKTGIERNDYYRCEPYKATDSALDKYLVKLETNSDTCAPNRLHRLAYGVVASLRDETRLYLAMLIDLYVNGTRPEDRDREEAKLTKAAKDYMDCFEDLLNDLKEVNPSMRQGTVDKSIRMDEAFNDLAKMFEGIKNPVTKNDIQQVDFALWSTQLLEQMRDVLVSYISYHSVLAKYEYEDRK